MVEILGKANLMKNLRHTRNGGGIVSRPGKFTTKEIAGFAQQQAEAAVAPDTEEGRNLKLKFKHLLYPLTDDQKAAISGGTYDWSGWNHLLS